MRFATTGSVCLFSAMILAAQSGCSVPQPSGNGMVSHREEPRTKTGYWLYLPADYIAANGQRPHHQRWPLVVTFHGMKPWDNAKPQVREWEQEADRYGFIIIAPELRTCDSFMQFPLKDPDLPYVKKDEEATLAIMDEVFRQTNADPARVLATSWSSGGYLAHFMVNRHPERFACLAVRHSNFNEHLMNPAQVQKYRNMRIGIFFGEKDFKVCREESMRAVEWYRQYRFPVSAKYVSGMGHERTPQTAAAFFATAVGATPKTPPDLGQLVMRDITTDELPELSRRPGDRRAPPTKNVVTPPPIARRPVTNAMFSPDTTFEPPAGREARRVAPMEPVRRAPPTLRTPPDQQETPKRPVRQPYDNGKVPEQSGDGQEPYGPIITQQPNKPAKTR